MSRALLLLVAAGCTDVPMPFELEHTRVMAVRLDPPAVAAGERSTVEVLVTDATDGARVASAAQVTVTSPAPLAIEQTGDGWVVTAPPQLPDGELVVPLEITIDTDDGPLSAQKTLALGTTARNPEAPAILQDGVPAPTVMPPDTDVVLTVDGASAELSYRWFSSVGDLTGYTRMSATLEPAPGARGQLGVVVRDQAGGTAWTLVDAEVGR